MIRIIFENQTKKKKIALDIDVDKFTATMIRPDGTPGASKVFTLSAKDDQGAGPDPE